MTKFAALWPDTHARFGAHPGPIWIYDADTLRCVAMNAAAIARYGYSRVEFLSMTTHDIRPREDQDGAEDLSLQRVAGVSERGAWRHVTRAGESMIILSEHDDDERVTLGNLMERASRRLRNLGLDY